MKDRVIHSEVSTRTPILSDVWSVYELLSSTGQFTYLSEQYLLGVGTLLIPHTQNLKTTISIGEFLGVDENAKVKKGQFWHFDISGLRNSGKGVNFKGVHFIVEKTDIWSGHGTQLGIVVKKRNKSLLGIFLQKQDLDYNLIVMNSKNEIVTKYSTFRYGKPCWKRVQ